MRQDSRTQQTTHVNQAAKAAEWWARVADYGRAEARALGLSGAHLQRAEAAISAADRAALRPGAPTH